MQRWITVVTAAMLFAGCATGYRRTVQVEQTMRVTVALVENPDPAGMTACLARCDAAGANRATCLAACPGAEVEWGACRALHAAKNFVCVDGPGRASLELGGECDAPLKLEADQRVVGCTDRAERSPLVLLAAAIALGFFGLLYIEVNDGVSFPS